MSPREALITGLRYKGWHPYTIGHMKGARWDAYRHPLKGTRTLWVTQRGQLRVGASVHSCEPVQQTFVESTINLGHQRLR